MNFLVLFLVGVNKRGKGEPTFGSVVDCCSVIVVECLLCQVKSSKGRAGLVVTTTFYFCLLRLFYNNNNNNNKEYQWSVARDSSSSSIVVVSWCGRGSI
mmetsp:Transcript_45984/g.112231  ORF Transcript_45984/g.112231 Transcript_45984/m.112231 type:complete len:99 (+) Transcript_45984:3770-4066(+)